MLTAKTEGVDKLNRDMKAAQETLKELEAGIKVPAFDPADPASIEMAIKLVEDEIDNKVGNQSENFIVKPMVEAFKKHCRDSILERAASARLEDENKQ